MELRTITFMAPSGHKFTIREQNGEDDSILSNPREMRNLLNLSRFISAITVETTATANGKLTMKDSLGLPLLDRYCILLYSRIFSLGEILEFSYEWPDDNGKTTKYDYEEDLTKYLFDDYSKVPTEEEMEAKPYAVPLYPDLDIINGKEFTLSSGKKVWLKAATSNSEQYILNLPEDKRNRNAELISRELKLEVEGKMERVYNFSMFSVKDMNELHKLVKTYDPTFVGITDIQDPRNGNTAQVSIMGFPSFFFLMEE
jgi:hypothetical protein